jgi:hypothetical protein
MKIIIRTTALVMFAIGSLSVKSQTLEESLFKAYVGCDTSKTKTEMNTAFFQFSMIAQKWNNQWIANYYAAYFKAKTSLFEADKQKKDLILDEADSYYEIAKKLNPENDELYVLAAFIANLRLGVDGATRWQKYGDIFNEDLEKAKKIRIDNPRIYYLKGISLFYTPEMFGGGKKKSKSYFEKAKELFDKENNSSVLSPYWGRNENLNYLSQSE